MEFGFRSTITAVVATVVSLGASTLLAASAQALPPSPKQEWNPWNPWLQIGLFGSNDLHRGEAELFLPNGNDTTIAFLDLRGNFFTEDFDERFAQ